MTGGPASFWHNGIIQRCNKRRVYFALSDLYKSAVFTLHWQLPEFNNLATLFREVTPNFIVLSTDSANLNSVEGFALKVARCARSLVSAR